MMDCFDSGMIPNLTWLCHEHCSTRAMPRYGLDVSGAIAHLPIAEGTRAVNCNSGSGVASDESSGTKNDTVNFHTRGS